MSAKSAIVGGRLAAAAVACCAVGVAALANTGSAVASGGASAKGKQVIMVLGVSGNQGYDSVACGSAEIAKKAGVNFTVQSPSQLDADAEIPVMQAAIAKHPAAIMLAPTSATALAGPVRQAVAAGIKVILFDANLSSNAGQSTWVGDNGAVGGALAAQTMNKLIGGKGQVMLINAERGITTLDARQDGFAAALKKYKGIDYLGPQYNNNDNTQAATETSSVIAAHPDLAGVYATNESEMEGAITGVQNSGKAGKIKMVGFDAAPPEVTAVKKGSVDALVAQDVHAEGTTAMQATIDVLEGKPVKKDYYVGFYAITHQNVNTAASKAHYYVAGCPVKY